jgi:hypothetical protein
MHGPVPVAKQLLEISEAPTKPFSIGGIEVAHSPVGRLQQTWNRMASAVRDAQLTVSHSRRVNRRH